MVVYERVILFVFKKVIHFSSFHLISSGSILVLRNTMSKSDNKYIDFGEPILDTHFPHMAATGVAMLNSGSFGISPISVINKKTALIQQFESFGDDFVRQHQMPNFTNSVQSVADLLNVSASQCTLVDNVTTGISNLFDLFVKPGQQVLVNSWTYGSVKMAADVFANRTVGDDSLFQANKKKIVVVNVGLPLKSADDFVDSVRLALDENPDIGVAVFDYITSSTACVMPVQRLSDLCRSRGILVIIDGAHAIGQIPNLDIPGTGGDFFIGNLHKWLFVPKTAALLWARTQALVDSLRPLVVSWLVREPELSVKYAFLGTRDVSSVCAVSQAVTFVRDVCGGLERIHSYCSQLADEASRFLVEQWGSCALPIPTDMQAPFMRIVALPKHLQDPEILAMTKEKNMTSPLWNFILNKLKMDILLLNLEGVLYIRVSFAIIVCMDNIRKLADTVMKLTKKDITG